jgi:predicted RNA binding protein YcfA (HicA-like mRNA interferase family)
MGTLANISGKEAVKAFAEAGWQTVGQVGSHLVMTKSSQTQPIYPSHSIKNYPSAHCARSFEAQASAWTIS